MRVGNNGPARRRRLPKGKRVARWPSYLLKEIPEFDRRRLSEEALAWDISVSDVIRGFLCDRYKLRCHPESYRYDPDRDGGSPDILLRLQPKVIAKLRLESSRTGNSMRQIILEAIEKGVV